MSEFINSNWKGSEVVSCSQMKEIEKIANDKGLRYEKMMVNAGKESVHHILRIAEEKLGKKEIDAVIFCGRGNNGGDGYVAAWDLAAQNMNVTVIMADEKPRTQDAIANANIVLRRGIPTFDAKEYFDMIPEILEASDIIVDAMYGTGFHGELKKVPSKCAKLINEYKSNHHKLVVAIDIPSGLNGDLPEKDANSVVADFTIALHRKKPVHIMDEMKSYCGEIIVADIGIDNLE